MKDDPLSQSTIDAQVRDQMSKHTLWLNADNFNEMVEASYQGYVGSLDNPAKAPPLEVWRHWQAAALAVVEWRMGGRVRP